MDNFRKIPLRDSITPRPVAVRPRADVAALEATLTRSTAWVVFEPNDEPLWAKVRTTVSDLLMTEWKKGVLLGTRPEQAFFVKCDRTTMTQADLEAGRLICLVGVAPTKPAEFVIFRIGQWTADRKS